jgi:hypothetical protein
MRGALSPLPNTSPWRGAVEKITGATLPLIVITNEPLELSMENLIYKSILNKPKTSV